MAWNRTKAQVEVKTSTEAPRKEHGEPIRMPEDWTSGMVRFHVKVRKELARREFQEKFAAGMLQAEPLDQVISQAEAEEQDSQKPDPPRQYGIHLNAALTIQTRRRYTSTLPKDTEEKRAEYDVLSNCQLLGQQRQPGRALYSDVDSTTFPQILKELLGKKNFALKKELDGNPLVVPPVVTLLSYEHELRREASKKCREQNMGFRAAWWEAYGDAEHRVLRWQTQPHPPRTRRLRASCKEKSQRSSGAAVLTGAEHPRVEEATRAIRLPEAEGETRDCNSQDLNNLLFLVQLQRRRAPRARERRKAKRREQVNAHQQGRYGFSTTF